MLKRTGMSIISEIVQKGAGGGLVMSSACTPSLSLSLSLSQLIAQGCSSPGKTKQRPVKGDPETNQDRTLVGGGGGKFRRDRTYSTLQQGLVYAHMGVYFYIYLGVNFLLIIQIYFRHVPSRAKGSYTPTWFLMRTWWNVCCLGWSTRCFAICRLIELYV